MKDRPTENSMYGLPQAGLLANSQLGAHLALQGYIQSTHTHGLLIHKTRPIMCCLMVDDFVIKYVGFTFDRGGVSLPLCEDDSEGMVGLLKAAQLKGTKVACEALQAHDQLAWNKARVDCGIGFQEEHAKLKVDEEEMLRQSKHDEDNRSLEGKVCSFALSDLDCYLAGLTFFGPLLPYRSMRSRRRLKATHGRVALMCISLLALPMMS
jgi:hypothetical protein